MNNSLPSAPGPIGVFDSGYGGLTVLDEIQQLMPEYDYLYLGDNARAPYGTRSFEVVYEFTLQAVRRLFELGCHLVILACNTASAKALRTIQQCDLPQIDPQRRVLGVIRPTTESVGELTRTGHVGIVATPGTIRSHTYDIEIGKLHPHVRVTGQACPMWVPLIENKEYDSPGVDYFVKKYIDQLLARDPEIDTILLGCTHYPLLLSKIRQHTPSHIRLVPLCPKASSWPTACATTSAATPKWNNASPRTAPAVCSPPSIPSPSTRVPPSSSGATSMRST